MTSLDDCFKKRLLIKTRPEKDLALKSLNQAEFFLNEAKELLKLAKERMAIISLYNAYFHTARALLFKDGVKERSHFCIARYIEEIYVKKRRLDPRYVAALDMTRDWRQEIQYSVEQVTITIDLQRMIKTCQKFLDDVSKLLE